MSLAYFFMLAGSEDLIKPDRMVQRFISRALGRDASPAETLELLPAACAELRTERPGLTPRLLDYVIWNDERVKATDERSSSKPHSVAGE